MRGCCGTISKIFPKPGYIGNRYAEKRVLLVGQNPGVSTNVLSTQDQTYSAALRNLRDQASVSNFRALSIELQEFVPLWPVSGKYFPLAESGLALDQIAYCNLVRCRTLDNVAPSTAMISNCVKAHFLRWLDVLKPKVVIFIGKWVSDNGSQFAKERGIAFTHVDRNRSLNKKKILDNRQNVAAFVRAKIS